MAAAAEVETEENVAVAEPPPQAKPAEPDADGRTKPKCPRQYVVVIENDDDHTFDYVIDALRKVFGHPQTRAAWLAMKVHTAGRAPVWSGSLEVAELKRDQVRTYGVDFYAPKPVEYPLGVRIEELPQ
ncbi:MAG: ATP-dependent Clp protease adaptor ClpS [Planctomycetota bacterium]